MKIKIIIIANLHLKQRQGRLCTKMWRKIKKKYNLKLPRIFSQIL